MRTFLPSKQSTVSANPKQDPHLQLIQRQAARMPTKKTSTTPISTKGEKVTGFVGADGKCVEVKLESNKLVLSDNASADLKELVGYVNQTNSPTAMAQVLQVANGQTKVHVKIVREIQDQEGQLGNGLRGLHQAHDKEGNALKWNSGKNDFDGTPAYADGQEGVYQEATVTVFLGNIKNNPQRVSPELQAAVTFVHELKHDTDAPFIQDLKNKREGKPSTGIDAHEAIYPFQEKVYEEIEQNKK